MLADIPRLNLKESIASPTGLLQEHPVPDKRRQLDDATPSAINLFIKGGVYGATETGEAFRMQRDDMWSRWKVGQSLPQIGRAFGKSHVSIQFVLSQHGGIVPAARRRSLLTLTLTEREDISRGIASGWSIRDIARGLERAVSTVSREVARHGGRPQYRANEADHRAWESALRPKACLLAIHVKLQKIVASKLILDWSPEQISGWLKMQNPEDESMPADA